MINNIIQNYTLNNIYLIIISLLTIKIFIDNINIKTNISKYNNKYNRLVSILNKFIILDENKHINLNLLINSSKNKCNDDINNIILTHNIDKKYHINEINEIKTDYNNKINEIKTEYSNLKLYLDNFIILNNNKVNNIDIKNKEIEENYIYPRYVHIKYKNDLYRTQYMCNITIIDTITKNINIIFNNIHGWAGHYKNYISINELHFHIDDFDINRYNIYRRVKNLSFDQSLDNNYEKSIVECDIIKMYDTIVPDILYYLSEKNIILDVLTIKHNIAQYIIKCLIKLTNYKKLQIKENTPYNFINELKIHCETNNIILEYI